MKATVLLKYFVTDISGVRKALEGHRVYSNVNLKCIELRRSYVRKEKSRGSYGAESNFVTVTINTQLLWS